MTRDSPSEPTEGPLSEEVRILHEKFLQRTRSEIAVMRATLRRFIQGDIASLATLKAAAHRIGGTGAMFGFSTVSQAAESIEHLSKEIAAQSGTAISRETQDRFERRMEALERAVEAVALHPP